MSNINFLWHYQLVKISLNQFERIFKNIQLNFCHFQPFFMEPRVQNSTSYFFLLKDNFVHDVNQAR